jgi:hypothetical protein
MTTTALPARRPMRDTHLIADAVGIFRRQKRRPFVGEFLSHGLFVLNAFREGKIRPALLGRICRLLCNPATDRIDVQIRDCLRLCRSNGDR